MKRHPIFHALWYTVNTLLVLCFLALLYGIGWEITTESYLKGFSDAVIPATATPDQKVEAILHWMASGPARHSTSEGTPVDLRNPEDTLNYRELLDVCGTATNAFVNLAASTGLQARRLLILDPDRVTKHVVAEVRIGDRWVVADPSFKTLLRDGHGQLVTKEQLRDPAIFQQATGAIPSYPPLYSYERTAVVRLAAIPKIGLPLRQVLSEFIPEWEVAPNWTLLLERVSFAFTVLVSILLLVLIAIRVLIIRYGRRKLNLSQLGLRYQVLRFGRAVLVRSE
jgi:hypothetical protein